MSTDDKTSASPAGSSSIRHGGMKIFTYPKIIFIWPTFVTAIICAIGMAVAGNPTYDPTRPEKKPVEVRDAELKAAQTNGAVGTTPAKPVPVRRFSSIQNVLGMMFVVVFFLNLMVMSIDFPRFTIIAVILSAVALTFFLLWLNVWFNIIPSLVNLLERVFAYGNSMLYTLIAVAIGLNFAIIYVTRYLDFWEILPNEILHNHGPFSDLDRYPTMNLKFSKEIPDILEYMLLRSGRLVMHIQNERKAIVLENVLWIDHKENQLKQLMSRMEVRVTTDQEAANEAL